MDDSESLEHIAEITISHKDERLKNRLEKIRGMVPEENLYIKLIFLIVGTV